MVAHTRRSVAITPARRVLAVVSAFLLVIGWQLGHPLTAFADGPTTFSNTSSIAIPATGTPNQIGPGSPYPSNITVSGMAGAVSKVQVRFNALTHSTLNDVDALVVAPSGENLVVLSDIGDPNTLAFANNATLTFDDAGPAVSAGNVATGTYRPTNTGSTDAFASPAPTASNQTTLAGAFTGIDPNGSWQLFIVDDASGDVGTMAGGWSLIITTEVAAVATTTTVTSSDTTSTTGSSVTFTATVRAGGAPVTSGTVQFAADGTNFGTPVSVNSSGVATVSTSSLTEGTHLIRGTFSGVSGFLTSNGTVSQRVDNATTINDRTYCNAGPITVPTSGVGAAQPYPSNIFVTGLTGQITKVTAQLRGVSHTAPIDLDILLAGPTSTRNLFLMSDAGGQNPISNLNLTFDDAAGSALGTSPTSGTYRPTRIADETAENMPAPAPALSGATALSTFDGQTANGTWSLYVLDDATGDGGGISGGWCLTIASSSPTVTTLAASPNPSNVGQSVTFTATVTSGGSPVTAGTVQFSEGATALGAPVTVAADGTATLTTSTLAAGTHTITASYGGTASLQESEDELSQVVNRVVSTTTLTSSENPSEVGDALTFTATVTAGGAPVTTGDVTFTVDGTDTLTAPVSASGVVTLDTSTLTAGTHTIEARYAGTTTYAPSSDDLAQVVSLLVTATTLTSSLNPSDVGDALTFTATVSSGGAPVTTGSVTFSIDGTDYFTTPVSAGGVATLNYDTFTAGTYAIVARYVANATYATSSASVDQVVSLNATTTTVTSSLNPSSVGDAVTFTATVVSGGAPVASGSVTFSVDGTPVGGAVPVSAAGEATLTTSTLTAGSHTIEASYTGLPTYGPSSDDLDQAVDLLVSSTTLTSSDNPSVFGDSVTFTATVSVSGAPVTAGSVTFSIDGTDVSTVAVSGVGEAVLTTATLSAGTHTVEARYLPTPSTAASVASLQQDVGQLASTTTVTSSPNPADFGDTVTLVATVAAGGAPVTSGSVQFSVGGTPVGPSLPVQPDGTVTITQAGLSPGTIVFTATFSGTADVAGSLGTVSQVINGQPTVTVLTGPSTSELGDEVTFTATVTSAGTPVTSGSVVFSDGATTISGEVGVDGNGQASLTTSALTLGQHSLSAAYTDSDGNFTASVSAAIDHEVGLTVTVGGPYTVAEGNAFTLAGTGSSAATYDWDLNGDNVFGDATGLTPTLTWAQLEALGINDGPSTYTISLRPNVGGMVQPIQTGSLSVTNTAPDTVLTGDLTATVGQPFTIKVGADDPSTADMADLFTYTVDWGDGSPVESVVGPADPPVTHTYTVAGDYDAVFTAADKDGGSGPGQTVVVEVALDEPSPTPSPTPTRSNGTDGSDDLPQTGADADPTVLMMGLGLVAVGALVTVASLIGRSARRRP